MDNLNGENIRFRKRIRGDQSDDYFYKRRIKRKQISEEGIPEVWETSPSFDRNE